jgi:hypothetical protein
VTSAEAPRLPIIGCHCPAVRDSSGDWLEAGLLAARFEDNRTRLRKGACNCRILEDLPVGDLVLAPREEGEDWCVGLRCPCGCGQRLEMILLKAVTPRWDLTLDAHL